MAQEKNSATLNLVGAKTNEETLGEYYARTDAEALARYQFQDAGSSGPEDSDVLEWEEQSAPDEAEEYVEDYYSEARNRAQTNFEYPPAAARQEYESDPFSWGPAYDPPAEAREEQYEAEASTYDTTPWSRHVTYARENLASYQMAQAQAAAIPLTGARQEHAGPSNGAHAQFVQQQRAAFDAVPGVPMDTSAGRLLIGRRRKQKRVSFTGVEVCPRCNKEGHTLASCPGKKHSRGRESRKGDNVTIPLVPSRQMDKESAITLWKKNMESWRTTDRRRGAHPDKTRAGKRRTGGYQGAHAEDNGPY